MQALAGALGTLLKALVGWAPSLAAFVLGGKRAQAKVERAQLEDTIDRLEERERAEDWTANASDDDLDQYL